MSPCVFFRVKITTTPMFNSKEDLVYDLSQLSTSNLTFDISWSDPNICISEILLLVGYIFRSCLCLLSCRCLSTGLPKPYSTDFNQIFIKGFIFPRLTDCIFEAKHQISGSHRGQKHILFSPQLQKELKERGLTGVTLLHLITLTQKSHVGMPKIKGQGHHGSLCAKISCLFLLGRECFRNVGGFSECCSSHLYFCECSTSQGSNGCLWVILA